MISNINVGCDPARVQQNDPKCFFCSWTEDGERKYFWSRMRFLVEDKKNKLNREMRKQPEYNESFFCDHCSKEVTGKKFELHDENHNPQGVFVCGQAYGIYLGVLEEVTCT